MAIDLSYKNAEGISYNAQNDGSQTEKRIREELDKNDKGNKRKRLEFMDMMQETRTQMLIYQYKQNSRGLSDKFHGLTKERWRNQQHFRIYGLVVGQNIDTEHLVVLE
jgi:hypothetical protein